MMKYLSLIPVALFPYIVFAMVWYIDLKSIDLAGVLLMVVLLYLVCLSCALIFAVNGIRKKGSARAMMNAARIIKLIHIPSYLYVFFVLGYFSLGMTAIMIMFPIGAASLLACWLFDVFCIIMSGIISSSAYFRAWREGKIGLIRAVISAILSFIFCVDVVVALIGFAGSKKKIKEEATVNNGQ